MKFSAVKPSQEPTVSIAGNPSYDHSPTNGRTHLEIVAVARCNVMNGAIEIEETITTLKGNTA